MVVLSYKNCKYTKLEIDVTNDLITPRVKIAPKIIEYAVDALQKGKK